MVGNPFNLRKALSLTFPQFRYGFANAVSESEARELYERWTIPSPCRPVFQAAMANLAGTATQVDTGNAARGPLLITGGEKDHQVPPVLGRASLAKYPSSLDTEFKLFEGRGHSLIVDSGWQDIARYSLTWLQSKGF